MSIVSIQFVIKFNSVPYRLLVESPRWYLSRGQTAEAVRVLEEMAVRNGLQVPKNLELKQSDRYHGLITVMDNGMRVDLCTIHVPYLFELGHPLK